MKRITKLAPKIAYIVTLFTLSTAMGFIGLYLAVGPDLPDVETIREIRLQTPMSVYSKDGQLINEFGDIRRIPITLDQVPQDFINALLSTEDARFYEHSGVDFKGVIRAMFKLVSTGTKSQGASTITMLVARNYYLTREKRFSRKFTEMFVAWKLESELSKNEILEIFLNKIPFGHRAAGLGAAAQVYYGTTLDKLSLAQLATLAGIPKGQSVFNPISNPTKAKSRREHVLGRMLTEEHITQSQYEDALEQPIKTTRHGAKITVNAHYVAEMVHNEIINRYGREVAHNDGLKIYTTLNPTLQGYAQDALRSSLLEYDKRHGYRPVEAHYDIDSSVTEEDKIAWISDFTQIGELVPALVESVSDSNANILLADGTQGIVKLEDSKWARQYIDENHRATDKLTQMQQILKQGDVIRVLASKEFESVMVENDGTVDSADSTDSADSSDQGAAIADSSLANEPVSNEIVSDSSFKEVLRPIFKLSQIPDVNGGFVVLNPKNGALEALAGGFDYSKIQLNMATQARRQLGSNIKPFIYSAALEKGFTAASLINDSPYIENDVSAGNFWRPENDSGKYRGPTRLRVALSWSINTVAIRLIKKFGPRYAKDYLASIGFPAERMRPFPSLALGSASFTPLEVATGYATLANGGFRVEPWFIDRIEDSNGRILFESSPLEVCEECLDLLQAEKLAQQELALEQSLLPPSQETRVDEIEVASESQTQKVTGNSQVELEDGQQSSLQTDAELALQLEIDEQQPLELLPLMPVAENRIAPRVLEARNRFIIDSILKDVIHRGTAWRTLNNAKSPLLRRSDIAGKTGTTNDVKDAWFSGYSNNYVASAWVGFRDHSMKLGKREFGGRAALPIWQKFMEKALNAQPQVSIPRPEGIVDVKIDLANGKLASANTKRSDFEVFRLENVPQEYSEPASENIIDDLDEFIKQEEEESDEIDF
jgi:penicillin-binding protein 1A